MKFKSKSLLWLFLAFYSCQELNDQNSLSSYQNNQEYLFDVQGALKSINWDTPIEVGSQIDEKGNPISHFLIDDPKSKSPNIYKLLTIVRDKFSNDLEIHPWHLVTKKDEKGPFSGEVYFYDREGRFLDGVGFENEELVNYLEKKIPSNKPILYNGGGQSRPASPVYEDLPEVTIRPRPRNENWEAAPSSSLGPSYGFNPNRGMNNNFALLAHMRARERQQQELERERERELQDRYFGDREFREFVESGQMDRFIKIRQERTKREEAEAQEKKAKEEKEAQEFFKLKTKNLTLLDEIFEGLKEGKFSQQSFHLSSGIYKFGIQAFAPFDMFGDGHFGDGKDRKFDLSEEASARIHQNILLDTKAYRVFTEAWAQETTHKKWESKTAIPNSEIIEALKIEAQNGAEVFTFATHVESANPIMKDKFGPFVPDIDIFAYISLKKSNIKNEIVVSGKLTGDNFPSSQAVITDPTGQKIFLGVGFYEKDGFLALFGANKNKKIMSFDDFRMKGDAQGKITHIKSKENEEFISVEEWNKPFLEADPHKNDPDRDIEGGSICIIM